MTYTKPHSFHKRHLVNDLFYGGPPDRAALWKGDKIPISEISKTRECRCDECEILADDMVKHNASQQAP